MMKHGLMALTICAALTLSACDNDTPSEDSATETREQAPPQDHDIATTLPDGMPPQPEIPEGQTVTPVTEPQDETRNPARIARPQGTEDKPIPLPDDLRSRGAPISPLCFLQTWEQDREETTINIDDCQPEGYSIVRDSEYQPAEDRIGVAYRPAAAEEDWPGYAFIEYEYYGQQNGDHIVAVVEAGGGSGIFSSLYRVNRTSGNTLDARMIAGGDRCNAGLQDVYLNTDNTLIYTQNLTPMALYDLGGGPTENVPASNELPDCAVCCYGIASFRDASLDKIYLNEDSRNLIGRMISDDEGEEEDVAACFDRITYAHIEAGQTEFTPESLQGFSREVFRTCLTTDETSSDRAEEIREDITLPDAPPEELDPAIDLENTDTP